MSKKIAAGADGIVLDVKCGKGAFMKSLDEAENLAMQMVDIGRAAGKQTRALVTSMDIPLGYAVGNALEVRESIETLKGNGPADLVREVQALAAEILLMAGVSESRAQATQLLSRLIQTGAALEKFREMIHSQGGDPAVIDDLDILPRASRIETVPAPAAGFVHSIDALAIGAIAMDLGAGRRAKGDSISSEAEWFSSPNLESGPRFVPAIRWSNCTFPTDGTAPFPSKPSSIASNPHIRSGRTDCRNRIPFWRQSTSKKLPTRKLPYSAGETCSPHRFNLIPIAPPNRHLLSQPCPRPSFTSISTAASAFPPSPILLERRISNFRSPPRNWQAVVVPENCPSLAAYLDRFVIPLMVLQSVGCSGTCGV